MVGDAEPFPVTGTLRQVANELEARGEAGSVTSQVTDAAYVATAAGRVRIVAITVSETLLMPVWTNRAERPAAEQREWDRFYAALLAHEREHIAIDRRVFENLHRRCLRKTIERMDELIDEAVASADEQNREFDTRDATAATPARASRPRPRKSRRRSDRRPGAPARPRPGSRRGRAARRPSRRPERAAAGRAARRRAARQMRPWRIA